MTLATKRRKNTLLGLNVQSVTRMPITPQEGTDGLTITHGFLLIRNGITILATKRRKNTRLKSTLNIIVAVLIPFLVKINGLMIIHGL